MTHRRATKPCFWDGVRANLRALSDSESGIFNVGAEQETTVVALSRTVRDQIPPDTEALYGTRRRRSPLCFFVL
jgi:hypothetical protein